VTISQGDWAASNSASVAHEFVWALAASGFTVMRTLDPSLPSNKVVLVIGKNVPPMRMPPKSKH